MNTLSNDLKGNKIARMCGVIQNERKLLLILD